MGADLSVNNESVAETQETEAEVVTTDVNTDSSETIEAEEQQLAEGSEAEIQSDEENAKYAAARRRAEQEFAKRQRESDLAFERRFAGYTNPITGQPIRSQKDYFDALDAQEKLQMEQSLQSGSVTADELNSYIEKQINNNPAILQAQQIIEATKQLEIQNRLENDVKEIQKLDSSVKSIDDILNKDNAAAMIQYVNDHNVSLADAYKMFNYDALVSQMTAGAKQATINSMKNTQHLNQTNGISNSDDGGVDIPSEELPQWKRAFPDCSMKELKAKYNKIL